MHLQNKAAIRGVVLLLVQGIDPEALGLSNDIFTTMPQSLAPQGGRTSKLPVFQQLFSHYCPTRAPGDAKRLHSVLQTLLNAPLDKSEKARRDMQKGKLAASSTLNPDPAIYLLPRSEFEEQGYILPTYAFDTRARAVGGKQGKKRQTRTSPRPFQDWLRPDGLIETPQEEIPAEDDEQPLLRIIAIDCEMVSGTG